MNISTATADWLIDMVDMEHNQKDLEVFELCYPRCSKLKVIETYEKQERWVLYRWKWYFPQLLEIRLKMGPFQSELVSLNFREIVKMCKDYALSDSDILSRLTAFSPELQQ